MPDDLYADDIVSHYEHPHNKRKMAGDSANFHEFNPVCGDDITIYLKISGGKITDASFDGAGCAISVAASSMLTDLLKGKSVKEAGGMDFNTIVHMLGIDPGPARLKCATLSLKAMHNALKNEKS